ncbi:hypothetical protein M9Y10_039447 [Tritrichomonas musculus]|uniref:PPM-type phosphatase domain-containing protein n=1 Tax=Tritrichomonas musculus TaxID=1915356 RepID=A0ABR2KD68_9EUKA
MTEDPLVIKVGNSKYNYGNCEKIGERPTMEDATVIAGDVPAKNYCYFAVYDGHGGPHVSHYAGKHIHESFIRHFTKEKDVVKSINAAFEEVNKYLMEKWPEEGCTAGVIIVSDDKVYSVNLGDVRAVMVYPDGKVERLSYDHKASDPEEKKMIEKSGFKVIRNRILGILAVSRALGDGEFEGIVGTETYVTEKERVDGAKVILACDGIWDVLSDEEAGKIAREINDPKEAAKAIVNKSLEKDTTDNVSCIVIDLTSK